MNNNVLLLNFQFRRSDGTEHEHGHKQVETRYLWQTTTQIEAPPLDRVAVKPDKWAPQIDQ